MYRIDSEAIQGSTSCHPICARLPRLEQHHRGRGSHGASGRRARIARGPHATHNGAPDLALDAGHRGPDPRHRRPRLSGERVGICPARRRGCPPTANSGNWTLRVVTAVRHSSRAGTAMSRSPSAIWRQSSRATRIPFGWPAPPASAIRLGPRSISSVPAFAGQPSLTSSSETVRSTGTQKRSRTAQGVAAGTRAVGGHGRARRSLCSNDAQPVHGRVSGSCSIGRTGFERGR